MTTLQSGLDITLSGQTGTGNFVGSTSPTLVSPTLGAATATSLTFSPSADGIVGTTTNNNAGAGYVGQIISSTVVSGSAVSVTSGTALNVTSISLTAGDWDVFGNVNLSASGSVMTIAASWVNLTSATAPDPSTNAAFYPASGGTFETYATPTPYLRVSIATTTTVYLSTAATFGSGTVTACGFISARRAR